VAASAVSCWHLCLPFCSSYIFVFICLVSRT
jgi:hypothetical protein